MNKMKITGIMATVLMTTGAAFAAGEDTAALTTKGYVDAGLKAVYQTATGAASTASANASSITSLQTTVGSHASSIASLQTAVSSNADDIATLQTAVSNLDTTAYTGENGVTVSDHKVKLDVNAAEGKMYVFKGGADSTAAWTELEVASVWDSTILSSGL